jgi:protoporphyrinogen oxidase
VELSDWRSALGIRRSEQPDATNSVCSILPNAERRMPNAGLLRRRDVLAGMLAAPLLAAGCDAARRLPPDGRIVDAAVNLGHRLRDGFKPTVPDGAWQEIGVVIVGGGIAGLSAAWELQRKGFDDFVVLELDAEIGGTSQSTKYGTIPAPWGAHYLPVPMRHQIDLIALLDEMGVLDDRGPNGEVRGREEFLCREPEERLYHAGVWHEGLFLYEGASPDDLRHWREFHREIGRWADWRDAQGRRAFTIPVSQCSDVPEATALDATTFAAWLDEKGWTSPRVRWSLDYACRDDYGLTLDQTSAWAGVFYFASRLENGAAKPQALLTWPEGNGRVVAHLAQNAAGKIHTETTVTEVRPASETETRLEVAAMTREGTVMGYRAKRVLWAIPQLLATRLIAEFADDRERAAAAKQFRYGCWLVANLCLSDRPQSVGFPPAWDNVFYESESLGYVVATHQQLRDHGPTVWTYYHPLCGGDPNEMRRWLLGASWEDLAEFVLADIERAHPEIRRLVTRLDVQRWGHGMILPEPGFVWSSARRTAAKPWRGIHFANTDLSGVALCEEAFHHGVRAAREVLAGLRGGGF